MSENKYIENIGCTKCGSSDAVGVYLRPDGSYFGVCFSCDTIHNNVYEEAEVIKSAFKKKSNIPELSYHDSSYNALKSRGISKEVCEKYEVKSILDKEGNDLYHFYPSLSKEGELAICIREVANKKFSWNPSQSNLEFFGQRIAGSNGKMIIITEGVCDCLASVEMLKQQGKNYRVVSVNNGAKSLVKCAKDNFEWLMTFENIFLAFDQDEPGQSEVQRFSELFPPNKVKNITFSEKDPNALLLAGKSKEFLNAIYSAKESRPDGIVGVEDLFDEAIKPPVMGLSFPWKTLTDVTYGYRRGELWGIGAGCMDAETEYLTTTGWKRLDEYSGGEVGQIDNNDRLSFTLPIEYIKEECDSMFHITARRGLDMMLSDEHRMVVEDLRRGIRGIIRTKEYVNKQNSLVKGCRLAIPTTFFINKKGIEYSDSFIRLKVAIFADGSFHKKSNQPRCCIRIKKLRKKERLESILNELKIDYKYVIHKNNSHAFYFTVDNKDKSFSSNWYNCSSKQLEIICDEVRFWDGSIDRWSYYTSIKEDADFIQYAHSAIGYRASISIQDNIGKLIKSTWKTKCIKYTVRRCRNTVIEPSYYKDIKKVNTKDGFKYCFKVPTGKLLCRRNRNIFITGNSGTGKTEWFKECINHTINFHHNKAGVIFLEEPAAKTLKVLAGKKVNKRFHIPSDKGGDWTIEELVDGINDLKGKVFLYNHFGAKDWESIKPKIRFMVSALGVKDIYLDHLTALVAQEDNEYKALNKLMEEMSSLCQELDCTIFYVSHLRKASGTPHEEGGRVTADQFKGSGSIVFWSNFLIGLERNQQAEDEEERNITTLRVLKDRNTGLATGTTFKLKYNHETGRWAELDEDEYSEEF